MFHGCLWHRMSGCADVASMGIITAKRAIRQYGEHHSDLIMGAMASELTGVSIVYSTVCPGADQKRHQSSASLVSIRGTHRWLLNSPYKGPVTRKMFPFDDVIMNHRDTDFPQMPKYIISGKHNRYFLNKEEHDYKLQVNMIYTNDVDFARIAYDKMLYA